MVVLPTALVIALDGESPTTIESIPQLTGTPRFDQVSILHDVVRHAKRGPLTPEEGMRRA
jgi:hypothetical protein